MNHVRQGVANIPEICAISGLRYVVISPGSRNAPLTIAFAIHPNIISLTVTDERVAAFFALGIARQTATPVGLICTSGSALLNYSPAIAEAYYQHIPLLILSADRPPELIDQEDGQAIRQHDVFHNFIKGSFQLPVETLLDRDLHYTNRKIAEAILLAKNDRPGPVHVNIPLREPLYDELPPINVNEQNITTFHDENATHSVDFENLRGVWSKSSNTWIIAGMNEPDELLSKCIVEIAEKGDALVFAENLSNISGANVIDSTERFFASLDDAEKAAIRPELIIKVGGPIVSKRFKQYLRAFKPSENWLVDQNPEHIDTFQSLTRIVKCNPREFLMSMGRSGQDKKIRSFIISLEERVKTRHEEFFRSCQFSDLSVFNGISTGIPASSVLHLANSTPVRYSQLFQTRNDVYYHSNRGVSGIDGCISTPAGMAYASGRQTIAVVGDLAFIYDSNAMWIKNLPSNLRIIVINNGEGNIFRLIKTGPSFNRAENFFTTPHNVNIKSMVTAFGLHHEFADTNEKLEKVLRDFHEPKDKPSVLEIKTSAEINTEEYKKYYNFISGNNIK